MTSTCCDTDKDTRSVASEGAAPTDRPLLDVIEAPDGLRLHLDVPGAGKDDVELTFEKRILTIRARVPARGAATGRYHVRERTPRDFVRAVHVGESIDPDGIVAEVKNGQLTVRLPKVAAVKPRVIEVG